MADRAKNLVCCEKPMEQYDAMFSTTYYLCRTCGTHATQLGDGTVNYSIEWSEKPGQVEPEMERALDI